MLNQLFNSIYSSAEVKINPLALIFSMITSLILGIVLAKVYKRQTIYTKEFVITLSLLPAIISIIIFVFIFSHYASTSFVLYLSSMFIITFVSNPSIIASGIWVTANTIPNLINEASTPPSGDGYASANWKDVTT